MCMAGFATAAVAVALKDGFFPAEALDGHGFHGASGLAEWFGYLVQAGAPPPKTDKSKFP